MDAGGPVRDVWLSGDETSGLGLLTCPPVLSVASGAAAYSEDIAEGFGKDGLVSVLERAGAPGAATQFRNQRRSRNSKEKARFRYHILTMLLKGKLHRQLN